MTALPLAPTVIAGCPGGGHGGAARPLGGRASSFTAFLEVAWRRDFWGTPVSDTQMWVTGRLGLGWVCACVALLLGVAAALAAPPRIDQSFGADGIASTSFPPQAVIEPFREIAATPDGGVTTRSSFYSSTELRHYGADGSLVNAEPELKNGAEIELQPPEAATPEGGRLVGVHTGGESVTKVSR